MGSEIEKQKPRHNRVVAIIIIAVVVLALGFVTYFIFYKFGGNNHVGTTPTPTSKATTSTPTKATPTPTNTPCAIGMSGTEQSEIADWASYTSATNHYSFKYPRGWALSDADPDQVTVRGTDSGELVELQIRMHNMTVIDYTGEVKQSSKTVKIACQSANEVVYKGENTSMMIADSFTYSQTPFLFLYNYADIGASYSGDMIDQQQLILKTFRFN
jgi:hypothetical protein